MALVGTETLYVLGVAATQGPAAIPEQTTTQAIANLSSNNGFPLVLGSTSIAASSTTTSVTGLSIVAGSSNTLAASTLTLVGSSATQLVSGRTSANPSLKVDSSTGSCVTGLNIKAGISGGALAVSVISSATNEELRIDAKGSGKITLGNTSTGDINIRRNTGIAGTLIVSSTGISAFGAAGTFFSDTAAQSAVLCENLWATPGDTVNQIGFQTAAGFAGGVTSVDNTTTYGTSSDNRLKENPVPVDVSDAGVAVDALHPVIFNWKNTKRENIGFLAQQEYEDLGKFAKLTGAVIPGDDNAELSSNDPNFKCWMRSDANLIPLLVAVIQADRKRILDLEVITAKLN